MKVFFPEGAGDGFISITRDKAASIFDADRYPFLSDVREYRFELWADQFHQKEFDRTVDREEFFIGNASKLAQWPGYSYGGFQPLTGATGTASFKGLGDAAADNESPSFSLGDYSYYEYRGRNNASIQPLNPESKSAVADSLSNEISGTFYDENDDPWDVTIRKRTGDDGDIDPNKKTWIIIHGQDGKSENFQQLAVAAQNQHPGYQILLVDWEDAARAISIEDGLSDVEARIPDLAEWIANSLDSYGFDGSNLSFIGYSFGANVAAEIGNKVDGGIDVIVALDPAFNVVGNSYNPTDSVNFSSISKYSLAFYCPDGLVFGNKNTAATADEAIVVKNTDHIQIDELFLDMLVFENGGNGVNQLFQLSRLDQHQPGPWLPNNYNSGGGLSPESGKFEAVITTTGGAFPSATSIQLQYVEITVQGNSINIDDGDITPTNSDGTDFGTAALGAIVDKTFKVSNTGNTTLTISNFNLPNGFIPSEPLSTSILSGESDTFTIRLDTTTTGTKSGQITFNTNDPNENPFNFQIIGQVNTAPAPEVSVVSASEVVADGDATPSVGEGTDFGNVSQGVTVDHTFTVVNSGNATLTTSNLVLPSGYDIVEPLSGSIPAGGVDSFTIRLDTATAGTKEGWLSFVTNDGDEDPFNFYISGTVNGSSSLPDIAVSWGGASIVDGDATPSDSEGTDFGAVFEGGSEARAFRVTNTGDAPLTISGISLPNGYTLTEGLSTSIAPGSFDYFTVELDTITAGTKSGEIQIFTNDSDESPYNFQITGTVNRASEIPTFHVAATPADMNEGSSGGVTAFSFTITRTGDTSTREGVSWDAAFPEENVLVATGDDFAEGQFTGDFQWFEIGEDTHTITIYIVADSIPETDEFFDIKLSFPTLGSQIGTERATFRIVDDDTPEIAVSYGDTAVPDGDDSPSSGEGSDFGSVEQGVSAVQRTFTVENVGTTTLALGAINLPSGFSLIEGLSTSLAPGDSDTFTVQLNTNTAGMFAGDIRFDTNDSDEDPFNFQITGVVTPPPPPPPAEILVSGGENISNSDATPSLSDFTDFGSVEQGDAAIERTFTVNNLGGSTLTLGAISLPPGFAIIEGLSSTIAAGAFDTFTIQLDTSDAGVYAGVISFSTNDSDENPFSFSILGNVLTKPTPVEFTEGPDTISLSEAAVDLHALSGDDSVTGSPFADSIFGDFGNDTIFGGLGEDTLKGDQGDDRLEGGDDSDVLEGGAGKDLIYGNNGDDYIRGGTENDDLRGSAGDDTMYGDNGRDYLRGNSGNDDLRGGAGGDTMDGGLDNDELRAASGDDLLKGSFGNDLLSAGIDDDLLYGNVGMDTLYGGDDNDTLFGNPGDDLMFGEDGNDDLRGGNDNDTMEGGAGNDTLRGNSGDDVFVYAPGADDDLIIGFEAGIGSEDVIDLTAYSGTFDNFADVLAAAIDVTGDVIIDLGGGDSIIIANLMVADLHENDFLFS